MIFSPRDQVSLVTTHLGIAVLITSSMLLFLNGQYYGSISIFSRAQCGMTSPLVTIEVHVSNGLPAFNIVGLPEKAVKESRDRVRSALMSNGLSYQLTHYGQFSAGRFTKARGAF